MSVAFVCRQVVKADDELKVDDPVDAIAEIEEDGSLTLGELETCVCGSRCCCQSGVGVSMFTSSVLWDLFRVITEGEEALLFSKENVLKLEGETELHRDPKGELRREANGDMNRASSGCD